jgi:lambda repressor-like predicted transcriptional regulator
MTRKTSTPGDTSDNAGLPPADAFQADTTASDVSDTTDSSSAAPKTTMPLAGTMEQQMAAVMAQLKEQADAMADLRRQNGMLVKQLNASAVDMPEPEELPTVAEAIASNPDAPVFTKEGWHVPAVTTANPIQRR